MTPEELKDFIEKIKDTDIEELSWQDGERKIHIKLQPRIIEMKSENTSKEETQKTKTPKYIPIKSKMVGIFHLSTSPESPPFVVKGTQVSEGQKIGIVESMRIYRDVTSPVNGKIVEILVNEGEPVEYGKDLFLVEPT